MKISFSRYELQDGDLVFTLPILCESDWLHAKANDCLPTKNFPDDYPGLINFLLSKAEEEDKGEMCLLETLDLLAKKGVHMTKGMYIPRHYMFIDSLFYTFRQIVYLSENIYRTKEGVQTFSMQFYIDMTKLYNCIQNNKKTKNRSGTLVMGIAQTWKGKPGLFRQHILGSRTCHTGRSVLVPDPLLKLDEVKLPHIFQFKLKLTETWTVQKNIPEDKITHVLHSEAPNEQWVTYKLWKNNGFKLSEGLMIKRFVMIGDEVLVNRQPSLRLQNILCLKIGKFGKEGDETIALNLALLNGFGGDCDGDELNIYVPQKEETREEVREKLSVDRNKIDIGTGKIIWGHTQDVCLGSYLNPELIEHKNGIKDNLTLSLESYYDVQKKSYDWIMKQGFSLSFKDLHPSSDCRGNWQIMVDSGAKGKQINLEQMSKSVGLQLVDGRPVSSVHHASCANDGVIKSSYHDGLTIGEFAQHCMAGWEGMISSAKMTADSGYRTRGMNHSLMNFDKRNGLKSSIVLGQTMTQAQLSGFHSTGQQELRSGLGEITSLLMATKDGNRSKQLFREDGTILFSFTELSCTQKGKKAYIPSFVFEAYDHHCTQKAGKKLTPISWTKNEDNIVEIDIFSDESSTKDFLKWQRKQTPAKILKLLYKKLLKEGNDDVFCSDIHLVEEERGWEIAREQLFTMYKLSFLGEVKHEHIKLLVDAQFNNYDEESSEEEYSVDKEDVESLLVDKDEDDNGTTLVDDDDNDTRLVDDDDVDTRLVDDDDVEPLVDNEEKKRFSSVTRHGNIYRSLGVLSRASWECPYDQIRKAMENREEDDLSDRIANIFFNIERVRSRVVSN